MAQDFTMPLKVVCNLKPVNYLFLEFSINIFRPRLTQVIETTKGKNHR